MDLRKSVHRYEPIPIHSSLRGHLQEMRDRAREYEQKTFDIITLSSISFSI